LLFKWGIVLFSGILNEKERKLK
jgi:hypothetical protein